MRPGYFIGLYLFYKMKGEDDEKSISIVFGSWTGIGGELYAHQCR
jgi:hypothetical protein